MFPTVNYGDYADPAALLDTIALPGGSQNYDNFNDPQLIALLNQARSTADPDQARRADRQGRGARGETLPWIPISQPTSVLVHELEADRRDGFVLLHVRAVGD